MLCLCCLLLFTLLYCYNVVRCIWIAIVDTVVSVVALVSVVAVAVYHSDSVFSVSYKLHFHIVFVSCALLGRSVARLSLHRTGIDARLVRLGFMVNKVLLLLFRFHSVTLPVLLTCRHVNTAFIGRTSGRILGTSKQSKGVSDVGGRVDRRSTCRLLAASPVRQ